MTKVRCILNDDIYIHDAGYVKNCKFKFNQLYGKLVRKFMWG